MTREHSTRLGRAAGLSTWRPLSRRSSRVGSRPDVARPEQAGEGGAGTGRRDGPWLRHRTEPQASPPSSNSRSFIRGPSPCRRRRDRQRASRHRLCVANGGFGGRGARARRPHIADRSRAPERSAVGRPARKRAGSRRCTACKWSRRRASRHGRLRAAPASSRSLRAAGRPTCRANDTGHSVDGVRA